jgi:hypothetical protein
MPTGARAGSFLKARTMDIIQIQGKNPGMNTQPPTFAYLILLQHEWQREPKPYSSHGERSTIVDYPWWTP